MIIRPDGLAVASSGFAIMGPQGEDCGCCEQAPAQYDCFLCDGRSFPVGSDQVALAGPSQIRLTISGVVFGYGCQNFSGPSSQRYTELSDFNTSVLLDRVASQFGCNYEAHPTSPQARFQSWSNNANCTGNGLPPVDRLVQYLVGLNPLGTPPFTQFALTIWGITASGSNGPQYLYSSNFNAPTLPCLLDSTISFTDNQTVISAPGWGNQSTRGVATISRV